MNILNSKNNINENKIKSKKTISLIAKTISSDWKILISLLFVCLVAVLFISWNLYRSVSSQSFLSGEEVTQTNSLRVNTEQLDRVVSDLNYKKEKFDELTGGKIFTETTEEISTSTPETQ